MQLRAVKGMNDLLPEELGRWYRLERAFQQTAERYGYREVRLPILEHTELFVRSVGETTDVVEKQMFVLERGRESLALRPEGTAGAARAYLSHSVFAKEPVTRWYYLGPMFRAEQPQRGRYRQFYQAGCELFGDPGPSADAEMIDMLVGLLRGLGIEGLRVTVNSIGGAATRARYRELLVQHLTPRASELSEHAQRRLLDNPLRILDSKDERDRKAVSDAPGILGLLDEEDLLHWDGLRRALDALETPYEVEPRLVRGLDYYCRTLFELSSSSGELGAQNTLCGGGRYDSVVADLGGPATPAVGFAMGLERIVLAMPKDEPARSPSCFFAPLGERALYRSLVLARELRRRSLGCEVDTRQGTMKSMLRRADHLGARLCVILGDNELERGVVTLKDLALHTQEELPDKRAAELIATRLSELSAADASGGPS